MNYVIVTWVKLSLQLDALVISEQPIFMQLYPQVSAMYFNYRY